MQGNTLVFIIKKYYDRALKRARKFSLVLERLISPEGTFPVFGRSIPYRLATMQPLALMAWYQQLPEGVSNGQARAALTSVMHRMYDNTENFNEAGFLTIGFAGRQPNVADWYTNNGSLYMTSLAFLPLGLPAAHPFWTDAAQPCTQAKAWGGQPFPKDHHWSDDIRTLGILFCIVHLIRTPQMIRSCFYTYPYHLRCSCLKNKSFVSSVSENGKKIVALHP